MSKWKNKDGKTVRSNTISGQWTWWTIEMLQSPAYRVMSLSARRIVDRVRIELANHGGQDNGKLIVTFQDFEEYGIHRHSIAPGIREAAALGFIRVTQTGRAGNGDFRAPNGFALTHLPTRTGKKEETVAATEDWRRIETLAEATAVAITARKASSAQFKKPHRKKQNASAGKCTSTSAGKCTSNADSPVPENAPLSVAKSAPLSISREGIPPSPPPPQSSGYAPAAVAPQPNGSGAKLKPTAVLESSKPNGHAPAAKPKAKPASDLTMASVAPKRRDPVMEEMMRRVFTDADLHDVEGALRLFFDEPDPDAMRLNGSDALH